MDVYSKSTNLGGNWTWSDGKLKMNCWRMSAKTNWMRMGENSKSMNCANSRNWTVN